MNDQIHAIAETVNQLAAKLMATELALQCAIRALPADARKAIAADLRTSAAKAMQEHAGTFSPQMDEQMTLSIAALLEAAGEPPKR